MNYATPSDKEDYTIYDTSNFKTRTYAPAETPDLETEGFPQLTIADTDWRDEERNAMHQHGYDSMDMLRAWLD